MDALIILVILALFGSSSGPPEPRPIPGRPKGTGGDVTPPWPQTPPATIPAWPTGWQPHPHPTPKMVERAWFWLNHGLRHDGPPQTATDSRTEFLDGVWVAFVPTNQGHGGKRAVEAWIPRVAAADIGPAAPPSKDRPLNPPEPREKKRPEGARPGELE